MSFASFLAMYQEYSGFSTSLGYPSTSPQHDTVEDITISKEETMSSSVISQNPPIPVGVEEDIAYIISLAVAGCVIVVLCLVIGIAFIT